MSRSGDARVDESADPAGAGTPVPEPVVKIAPSRRLRSHPGGGLATDPEQKPVPRRAAWQVPHSLNRHLLRLIKPDQRS